MLSLAQKVFRNPTSELTKPHTHLIRFILSGSNSLTALTSISLSHTLAHSNGSRHSSVRLNRSVSKIKLCLISSITFSQNDGAPKLREVEQNADFSYFTGNPYKWFFIFWVIPEIKRQLALLSAQSFQESNIRTNKTSYASNSVYFEWV